MNTTNQDFTKKRIIALKDIIKTLSSEQKADKSLKQEIKFSKSKLHSKQGIIQNLSISISRRRTQLSIAFNELDLITNNLGCYKKSKSTEYLNTTTMNKYLCKVLETTGFIIILEEKLNILEISSESLTHFDKTPKDKCKYFESIEDARAAIDKFESLINESEIKGQFEKDRVDYIDFEEEKSRLVSKNEREYRKKIAALDITREFKERAQKIETDYSRTTILEKHDKFINSKNELLDFKYAEAAKLLEI